jgi:IS4 transposase
LQAGRCYLADRGYQGYELLRDILTVDSDFVIRQQKRVVYDVLAERPLSTADRLAGVQQDLDIHLTSGRATRALGDRPLRLVVVASDADDGEPVLLLTNRCDWPAELVGLLYRYRWQIELFFRWLKCTASFRHFFSESPAGMTLQVYIALIGTLLLALATGAAPSSYDFALLSHVASGLMTLEGALEVMAKRRAERARAKAWQEQYRARRKAGH